MNEKDFEKVIAENCELHYTEEMQNDIPKAAAACYELAKQMAIEFAKWLMDECSDSYYIGSDSYGQRNEHITCKDGKRYYHSKGVEMTIDQLFAEWQKSQTDK